MATKKKRSGDRTKIEDKVAKFCGGEVLDTMLNLDEKELREKLVSLAQYERETEDGLEKDDGVRDLKEQLKNATGPYKDKMKGIKLQRTLAVVLLEDQGKA